MNDTKVILPVEAVQERDIDFLLVEEFLSEPNFINFFMSELKLPKCDELISVQRSIHDFDLGETDVLVEYKNGDKTIGLMIENKLDALFQPNQAKRYSARAAEYKKLKKYNEAFSVLVAPLQYVQRQSEFNHTLSYEDIIRYFEATDLGARGNYKIMLLRIAIERLRRGYVPKNSEPNQAFWQAYREYISKILPEVFMKPVGVVPAQSDWIGLSMKQYKIVHKLAKGQIDIDGLSEQEKDYLMGVFEDRAERATFTNSEVLRIQSAALDRMSSFVAPLETVDLCFEDVRQALISLSVKGQSK